VGEGLGGRGGRGAQRVGSGVGVGGAWGRWGKAGRLIEPASCNAHTMQRAGKDVAVKVMQHDARTASRVANEVELMMMVRGRAGGRAAGARCLSRAPSVVREVL